MTYRFSVPGIAGGNIGLQGAINDANNIPMPLLQAPQKTGLLGINQRLEGLATNPLFNMGIGMLGSQSPHLGGSLADGGRQLQSGVMLKERMKDQSSNREYRNKMLDLAKLRANQRRMVSGADGYQYYEDGSRVLPNVQAKPTAMTSVQSFWNAYLNEKDPVRRQQMYDYQFGLAGRPQGVKTFDIGDVTYTVDPSSGEATPVRVGNKQVTPEMVGENQGTVNELSEAGKIKGTQSVEGTPAQKAIDTSFADEYVNWVVKGGSADADKQIAQLEQVRDTLGKANVTGPIVGRTPDTILSMTNPDAINTRDLIEEVVQRNLRLILGPQFTEDEGKRLIARAYNPTLEEEDNTPRVERLLSQMIEAKKAKDSAAKYYEENGTLRGWQGKLYTISDFEQATSGDYDAKSMKSKYGLE